MVDISRLKTESRNPKTMELDRMSAADILKVMNEEDGNTVRAVQKALPEIAKAVEACIQALNRGGRMIYIGAGTSGRMGVMDAVDELVTAGRLADVRVVDDRLAVTKALG